ncbi:MAG: MFS transporter [Gammaproteobacteria bacterium]
MTAQDLPPPATRPALHKSRMFWVGVLYFAQGFPLGAFYDLFPVYFRQQGVDLAQIGVLSLLGLSWSIKFLWAPAIDHFRHHRRWMLAVDLSMGSIFLLFAVHAGFGPWVWFAIGLFTLLSATNDIAIDGYTIELLDKHQLGLANGLRIGFYRVGMLGAGFLLALTGLIGWSGAFIAGAVLLAAAGLACFSAPRERARAAAGVSAGRELRGLLHHPRVFIPLLLFMAGLLAGALRAPRTAAALVGVATVVVLWGRLRRQAGPAKGVPEGPLFGALLEMLQRPYFLPVMLFVLTFKLADSAMGFMVKPFWVDAGFSATQIGLVSVNIGLVLSIAGGLAGGWFTDRAGIFRGLWVLGLLQAFSNLGYAWAAHVLPLTAAGTVLPLSHKLLMYSVSALESFTSGLGTAAFLAFLMVIVNKKHSATEYALLSSIFALSRSVAGWASGYGAQDMGYSDYFLFTFFLAFPAYLLLPWVKKMLDYVETRKEWDMLGATGPASAADGADGGPG